MKLPLPIQLARLANLRLALLKRAIETNQPFDFVVRAARDFVERADKLEQDQFNRANPDLEV